MWTQEPDPESLINHLFNIGQLFNLSDLDVLLHKMGVGMLGRINELRHVKCLEQPLTHGGCSVGGVIVILLLGTCDHSSPTTCLYTLLQNLGKI